MPTDSYPLPSLSDLETNINAVLNSNNENQITIVDRWLNDYASSHSTEIVTYRKNRGLKQRLFLKYGGTFMHGEKSEHYRTVSYEARVYKQVLSLAPVTQPEFIGVSMNKGITSVGTFLMIQYLSDGVRLSELNSSVAQEEAVMEGAGWLGQFHRFFETRAHTKSLSFLKPYDADYYMEWARKTALSLKPLRQLYPWLPDDSSDFKNLCDCLRSVPSVVIHGDLYAHNILVKKGSIYPVDWESAAFGSGEIDLASLIEGWDDGTIYECERIYQQARWPENVPEYFDQSMTAARLYWHFGWLMLRKNQNNKKQKKQLQWRLDQVRLLGNKSGLI